MSMFMGWRHCLQASSTGCRSKCDLHFLWVRVIIQQSDGLMQLTWDQAYPPITRALARWWHAHVFDVRHSLHTALW